MTTVTDQKILSKNQSLNFNNVYVNEKEFGCLHQYLRQKFEASDKICIADFGGGNGAFCDILLDAFPNAIVYNIDISADLLSLNTPHERKHLVHSSFLDFDIGRSVDVVCLNYVLHHMVSSSVKDSIDLINQSLKRAYSVLSDGGCLVVFENILYSYLSENISSYLLYKSTSSKILAPITKSLGANTAGVGVYYMGKDALVGMAAACGFTDDLNFDFRTPRKSFKLLPVLGKEIRREGFVFTKS